MVLASSCPRVEAYATPYVMGRRLAAVSGFGTIPLTISPRITDTTGSDALMTMCKKRLRKVDVSISKLLESLSCRTLMEC